MRFSIKLKLALLLTGSALGMIGSIVAYTLLLRSATRTLSGINAQNSARSKAALDTVELAANLQDFTLKLVRERDLDNIELLVRQSDAATAGLQNHVKEMGGENAATGAALASLTKANASVRAAVMLGEGARAHLIFVEESTPAFQLLLARIRGQQQQYEKSSDEESRQVQSRLRTTQVFVIVVVAILVLLVNLIGALLTRSVAKALGDVVERVRVVAGGDLRVSLEGTEGGRSGAEDEIGDLYLAFNDMLENLRSLQARVSAAFRELEQAVGDVTALAGGLQMGAEKQSMSVEEIASFISRINEQAGGVARSMETQVLKSEETSSSIVEMISSIDEVSKNAQSLSGSVEETSSAIVQVLSSNAEVSRSVSSLNQLISKASVSIAQIDTNVKEVQSLAQESQQISVRVRDNAQHEGSTVIQEAVGEMSKIRTSVLALSETVDRLSDSVGNIGKILVVIEHVAQQTNLLALNAAIIAAQAGEHGRGFAVVADEIRELAERTTSSTKEIAQVITGIQTETRNVGALVRDGVNQVDVGVKAVNRTDQVLRSIISGSEQASLMSSRIANATREQAAGSLEVARSIREVVDLSSEISHATLEQAEGSANIIRAVESMRDLAEHVRRAMGEQTSAARLISKASMDSNQLAQQVTMDSQESRHLLERAVNETANISSLARGTLEYVSRMKRLVESFDTLAGHLKETLSQFRT